jgi:chromosome segregation ATPase
MTSAPASIPIRARRVRNSGSVYQTADGKWEATITVERGRRLKRRAKTREEAETKLAQLREEISGLPEHTGQRLRAFRDLQTEVDDLHERVFALERTVEGLSSLIESGR